MILSEEVTIRITNSNIRRYRELGYECSINKEIVIPVEKLFKDMHVKIKFKCDECEKEVEKSYKSYFDSLSYKIFGYGSYFCKSCVRYKVDTQQVYKQETIRKYWRWHEKNRMEIPPEHIIIDLTIDQNYKHIPNFSGIYRFYDKDNNLLYVGKAANLRSRIFNHISLKSNTKDVAHLFKKVSCTYIERTGKTIDIIEKFMINELKPTYNKSIVYS